MHRLRVVRLFIHPQAERAIGSVFAWSRDDDFLGTAFKVQRRVFTLRESSCALEDDVDLVLTVGECGGIFRGGDMDLPVLGRE